MMTRRHAARPSRNRPGAARPQGGEAAAPGEAARADEADDDARASGDALLRLGASAVATPSGRRVGVVTKAGRWNATLDRPETDPAGGASAPGSLGALVAGLVPGLLLGWSWPDLLRHAVAVAAAADPSGDVNLAEYERLVDAVTVRPAG